MSIFRLVLKSASIVGIMVALSSTVRVTAFQLGKVSAFRSFRHTLFSKLASTAPTLENPLLQQESLPKFESIQPKDLTPAVNTLLEKLDADFEQLESKLQQVTATVQYEQVLPELEKMQFGLGYVWGVAGHLNGVKNGDTLRAAYEENQPRVVQALTKFSQSKPVYDALESIQKQWEASSLDEQDFEVNQKKRAVEGSLLSMKLGGVGLEGEAKEKFNEMKMKLAELSTKFSNNVLDATKSFSMTVEDPAMMKGVPESAKAMWANTHVMHLKSKGEEPPEMNAEAGPWRITHDMPSYIAAMQHLPDRSLREKIYRAYISRAADTSEEGKFNNVPLVYEILRLKQEMAKMLGFQNHAERR
jgi:oligopeptidase A